MVFPDLFKEEESCAFSVEGGVRWDEVCALVRLLTTHMIAS
jgi:hypothetical protein